MNSKMADGCKADKIEQSIMKILPGLVAHADWGSAPGKRWITIARYDGSGYVVDAPEPVGDVRTLISRLIVRATGTKFVVGFDFPIGLPAAYAQRAGIENYLETLLEFGEGVWKKFYTRANKASEISIHRPFYPFASGKKGEKKQSHLIQSLGLARKDQLFRLCERSRVDRKGSLPAFLDRGA